MKEVQLINSSEIFLVSLNLTHNESLTLAQYEAITRKVAFNKVFLLAASFDATAPSLLRSGRNLARSLSK